jgi:hypothetical protein
MADAVGMVNSASVSDGADIGGGVQCPAPKALAEDHGRGGMNWNMAGTGGPDLGCARCGRAPSKYFSYLQIKGAFLFQETVTVDEYLCQECSRRIGRSMQSATLLTGWWGVRASFLNVVAIVTNTTALVRAATMSPPVGGPISFDKERSVLARARSWIGIAFVAGLIFCLATAFAANRNDPGGGTTNDQAPRNIADWSVGACVTGYGAPELVSCSSSHTGRIIAATNSEASCPRTTEIYVEDRGGVLCIDSDL